MKETIFDIIIQVRPKKIKKLRAKALTDGEEKDINNSPSHQPQDHQQPTHVQVEWTTQEEHQFVSIAAKYGCDYSTLNNHFPSRSRKQIIRKYERLHKTIARQEQKLEQGRRLQRKCIFETDVLELAVEKETAAELTQSDCCRFIPTVL